MQFLFASVIHRHWNWMSEVNVGYMFPRARWLSDFPLLPRQKQAPEGGDHVGCLPGVCGVPSSAVNFLCQPQVGDHQRNQDGLMHMFLWI